jgi:uncharacterized protein (TIGR01777 family)
MRIALVGGSGFIGEALVRHFDEVVLIARSDGHEAMVKKLEGVEVVINLAGASILKRWTKGYKKMLLRSRIERTRQIVKAIEQSQVKHFISTSAVGIYPSGVRCDEQTKEVSDDFLAHLAEAWEAEALKCTKPTAIVRLGVVLGRGGGALAQMLPFFRWGLGGRIGNGLMMMSWIDRVDLLGIYDFIIETRATGVFNATSPTPVSNRDFTTTLGKTLARPTPFPIPLFMLYLRFGEGASVLIDSKEVYPTRLLQEGYRFSYPTIERSLARILSPSPTN